MIGIYKIQNKTNNKVYIGKSKNIMQRWATHEQSLKNGSHHSLELQEDYNKSGFSNFDFSALELCNKDQLNEKEKFYVDKYDSVKNGYNIAGISKGQKENIVLNYQELNMLCQKIKPSYIPVYLYLKFICDDNNCATVNQSDLSTFLNVAPITIH